MGPHTTTEHDRDLHVAIGALEAVQHSIRRADTKAAALVGFQLSVITIALGRIDIPARAWGAGTGHRIAAIVLAVALVGGLAASLGLLGAVLWPRWDLTDADNRFAFPALAARSALPDEAPGAARAEAWRLTIRLSRTAKRKYELIRPAICAMAGSSAAIVGWLCLGASSQ